MGPHQQPWIIESCRRVGLHLWRRHLSIRVWVLSGFLMPGRWEMWEVNLLHVILWFYCYLCSMFVPFLLTFFFRFFLFFSYCFLCCVRDLSFHLSCLVLKGVEGRLFGVMVVFCFPFFLPPDMPPLVGVVCVIYVFCLLLVVFASASACGVACMSVWDWRDGLGCEGVFWTVCVCLSYDFVSMFEM